MTMQMLLAAAKPWTYWFAPPLLIATLVLIAVLAVGYYRRVMVPSYLWRLQEERRARSSETAADVRALRRPARPPLERLAA